MEKKLSYEELLEENKRLNTVAKKQEEIIKVLRQDINLFQILLDNVPIPAFYKTRDGKYNIVNQKFAEVVLGMPKEEIIGKGIYDFDDDQIPSDLKDYYHIQEEKLWDEQSETQSYTKEVQESDKIRKDYFFLKSKVKDTNGNVIGMIGLMINITTHKHTMLFDTITKLSGSIAHEINNGLSIIQSGVELIEYNNNYESENQELTNHINKSIRRITKLVNMLLAYSQEIMITQTKKISIKTEILTIINSYKSKIEKSEVNIHTILDEDAIVKIQPTHLNIILTSVISNAIEASNPFQNIKIFTKTIRKQNQDYVKIVVQDYGKGIPKKDLEKIFDPFFSTKFLGRGMGLSACNGLLAKYGGQVEIFSKNGIGTKVTIFLPVHNEDKD